MLDDDLDSMSRDALAAEVRRLRAGIRVHRDSSGHQLCWHHPQLWGLLPERIDPAIAVPPWPKFLRGCVRYREALERERPDAPAFDREYEEGSSVDHIGYAVSDLARSRRFYEAALAPLGIAEIMVVAADRNPSGGTAVGYGKGGNPFFWIGDNERTGEGTHIAFTAATRGEVDAFHAAAIAAGGRDHGAPGLRPHYHQHYYAAFVFDPDRVNVEAVCHAPA